MDELELAHQDYEKRKQRVLYKLDILKETLTEEIDEVIDFIKEKEI